MIYVLNLEAKIKLFDENRNKKVLFDFYEQIKDYKNVIFDFTMNGGGGMSYFDDLIVAPNIDKPLSADVYELAKAGSLNEEFIEVSTMDDISNLPELPKMNQDDLKELDAMLKNTYEVKPLTGKYGFS